MTTKQQTTETERTLPGELEPAKEGAENVVPTDPATESASEQDDEPETFPREYVERLREENAKYRTRRSAPTTSRPVCTLR